MVIKFLKKTLKHVIPKELLQSNIRVDKKEKKEVLKKIAIERKWHEKTPALKSHKEVIEKHRSGQLKKVAGNDNFLPILRLRNPELIKEYPPFLTEAAAQLLEEICTRWRQEMNKTGADPDIRVAITSMVRTKKYQKKLVRAGKLADPKSVHTKGEAFDIDASGYYLGETPINARKNIQGSYAAAFKKMSAEIKAPAFGDYSKYNPKVHKLLKKVLTEMQKEEKLHFIHEFPNTKNDVFHVCRNPEYK